MYIPSSQMDFWYVSKLVSKTADLSFILIMQKGKSNKLEIRLIPIMYFCPGIHKIEWQLKFYNDSEQ